VILQTVIEVANPAANGLIASSVFNIFYFGAAYVCLPHTPPHPRADV
jgi:hypothetical protein